MSVSTNDDDFLSMTPSIAFEELTDHCCRALHDSYEGRSVAFVPFDKAPLGVREKSRQDVQTILMAAAARHMGRGRILLPT